MNFAGLPTLYHENGGSIVNYCQDYGAAYDSFESMIDALKNVVNNYKQFKKNVLQYNTHIDDIIKNYIKVIENV